MRSLHSVPNGKPVGYKLVQVRFLKNQPRASSRGAGVLQNPGAGGAGEITYSFSNIGPNSSLQHLFFGYGQCSSHDFACTVLDRIDHVVVRGCALFEVHRECPTA